MDKVSENEKNQIKLRNRALVHHAMSFPQVDYIVYMTHSVHKQENEQVLLEAMERYGNDEWELECVLPQFPADDRMDSTLDTESDASLNSSFNTLLLDTPASGLKSKLKVTFAASVDGSATAAVNDEQFPGTFQPRTRFP